MCMSLNGRFISSNTSFLNCCHSLPLKYFDACFTFLSPMTWNKQNFNKSCKPPSPCHDNLACTVLLAHAYSSVLIVFVVNLTESYACIKYQKFKEKHLQIQFYVLSKPAYFYVIHEIPLPLIWHVVDLSTFLFSRSEFKTSRLPDTALVHFIDQILSRLFVSSPFPPPFKNAKLVRNDYVRMGI